ncbi:MAG: hypothetical protein SWY16_07605 [Cyanobacteriota bacterium]|nr:hypothetical protein [Cyanobacteriota bacterium]
MISSFLKTRIILGTMLLVSGAAGCTQNESTSPSGEDASASPPTVVTLTQTGCQFLETEARDYEYQPANARECDRINAETLSEREAQFKPLTLKPGDYIFKVTNQDVPYELGFYLRGAGATGVRLPKVSGGGLNSGTTAEYQITLKPGNYVFSCPLNPTPDYPIVVE